MGHTFSSLKTKTTKLPIYAWGIYPAFLTLRDEESSLSSSEEKSSKFDWLESKITRNKNIWKAEQVLCILLPCKTVQRIDLWEQAPKRYDSMIYYKTIYKELFTLFPNLITKESYNWWVTRRVWGFRHQISKAKYLQVSVAHIWKLQENTAALCRKISKNVGRSPGERY